MRDRRSEFKRKVVKPTGSSSTAAARKRELLLISGVEGGGVTLYGKKYEGQWLYSCSYADQTPLMLDEPAIEREAESGSTDSWDTAVQWLDSFGWLRLPAVYVHPDLRGRVWALVQQRLAGVVGAEKRLARWRERCGVDLLS